jgi:hypothetical protein
VEARAADRLVVEEERNGLLHSPRDRSLHRAGPLFFLIGRGGWSEFIFNVTPNIFRSGSYALASHVHRSSYANKKLAQGYEEEGKHHISTVRGIDQAPSRMISP